MKLKDFVDLKKIQEIQDQFSNATGLAAIAVDADGNYITTGSNFTDFCMKYTRGSEEGARRCIKCDNECTGAYFCHAGLMDFSSDIVVNGERVGAIIGGQVLPHAPDYEKFRGIARELGIDENKYIQALDKVPVRSEHQIRSAAEMLGNVVNQLVNLEYLKTLNQKKIDVFHDEQQRSLNAIHQIKTHTREMQSLAYMENMLSISAAIEAGRAGKAGAGFNVVAQEIGELSKKSTRAYGEIQKLVETIEQSVTRMEEADL